MNALTSRRLRSASHVFALLTFTVFATILLSSCSSGTTAAASSSGGGTTSSVYQTAYKALTWPAGVTATFPSDCSMKVTSTGVPPVHNTYYLTPVSGTGTVVATTASGIRLQVTPYAGGGISNVNPVTATFNICPAKAAATTATSMGAIGVITSGEVLFNAYEATGTVAQGDNVSYTFTSGGTSYTAYFIDQCNSHAAGGMGAGAGTSTWHYHANPVCYTATVDGASGPSHIIGVALDGFPIYGGRDISGNTIDPATLDACNGITSVTPEFATATYHYVLPIGVTTKQSSIGCYAGTVSATLSAQMQKLACRMPGMQMANAGPMSMPPALEPKPMRAALNKPQAAMGRGM